MEELKCLVCGSDLIESHCLDITCDCDGMEEMIEGYCPECGEQYTWTNVYTYSKFKDFQKTGSKVSKDYKF